MPPWLQLLFDEAFTPRFMLTRDHFLLLLDESNKHLDLPFQALEALLASHPRAMLVASHYPAFLGVLGVVRWVECDGGGVTVCAARS